MNEWLPIPGFSNYEATLEGMIRSKDREITQGKGRRIIAGQIMYGGKTQYKKTKLCISNDNGEKTTTTPQRLIYLAAHGHIPKHSRITFVDDDDRNLHYTNLKAVNHGDRTESNQKRRKRSRMEGFNELMQWCLSSPLRDNPQWVYPWQ
jgi:hypothetical protein